MGQRQQRGGGVTQSIVPLPPTPQLKIILNTRMVFLSVCLYVSVFVHKVIYYNCALCSDIPRP